MWRIALIGEDGLDLVGNLCVVDDPLWRTGGAILPIKSIRRIEATLSTKHQKDFPPLLRIATTVEGVRRVGVYGLILGL
jgi:hypothetical protein